MTTPRQLPPALMALLRGNRNAGVPRSVKAKERADRDARVRQPGVIDRLKSATNKSEVRDVLADAVTMHRDDNLSDRTLNRVTSIGERLLRTMND